MRWTFTIVVRVKATVVGVVIIAVIVIFIVFVKPVCTGAFIRGLLGLRGFCGYPVDHRRRLARRLYHNVEWRCATQSGVDGLHTAVYFGVAVEVIDEAIFNLKPQDTHAGRDAYKQRNGDNQSAMSLGKPCKYAGDGHRIAKRDVALATH